MNRSTVIDDGAGDLYAAGSCSTDTRRAAAAWRIVRLLRQVISHHGAAGVSLAALVKQRLGNRRAATEAIVAARCRTDPGLSARSVRSPRRTRRVIQTHISYVLLAGDFAYKIKKPLDLHFLDYSTLEKRRLMCEAEVRLNRRLCPEAYIGVVPIVRTGAGYAIGAGAEAVEYAVKMHRMPHERMPELLARSRRGRGRPAHRARAGGVPSRCGDQRRDVAFGRECAAHELAGEFDRTECTYEQEISKAARRHPYVERRLREDERLFDARAAGTACATATATCARDRHPRRRFDLHHGLHRVQRAHPLRRRDERRRLPGCGSHSRAADLADELVAAYLGEAPDETLPPVLNFYRCYRRMCAARSTACRATK
jgi:aminoglycoside phosphotransferase family enzyme